MRRRALLLCGFPCLLAFSFVAAYFFLAPRPKVTHENFERIKHGMSEAEVVEILGNSISHHKTEVDGKPETMTDVKKWNENKGVRITVWFNLSGVVRDKFIADEAIKEETIIEKARRWLRL
jgi:hypothetical protein